MANNLLPEEGTRAMGDSRKGPWLPSLSTLPAVSDTAVKRSWSGRMQFARPGANETFILEEFRKDYQILRDEFIRFAISRMSSIAKGDRKKEAEDIVDNAFADAWEKRGQFRGNGQLRTWLFGFVKKELAEWHRLQGFRRRHEAPWPSPPEKLKEAHSNHEEWVSSKDRLRKRKDIEDTPDESLIGEERRREAKPVLGIAAGILKQYPEDICSAHDPSRQSGLEMSERLHG